MNSSLYYCTVMHHRLKPLKHRFMYKIFMFYLDLDELDMLAQRLRWFSRNQFNIFSFRDKDHIVRSFSTTKENIKDYLNQNGINLGNGKIFLLTHVRMVGYVFNPVSFYFCFDGQGKPLSTVAEVGNTFKELKPYFLGPETFTGDEFRQKVKKYFYVSPFIDLDTTFEFMLPVPEEQLKIRVNDYQGEEKIFISSLTGTRRPLTDGNLLRACFRFPLVTFQVITLIHYHALILLWKKLPFHNKTDNPELQQEVYVWNK